MGLLRSGLLVSLALIALGCAGSKKSSPVEEAAGIDGAACRAAGGEVKPVCLSGTLACVTPYADAGEPCEDSAGCEGKCLVVGELPEVGTKAVGACQKDDNPCGCFVEVIDGEIQQGLCAD